MRISFWHIPGPVFGFKVRQTISSRVCSARRFKTIVNGGESMSRLRVHSYEWSFGSAVQLFTANSKRYMVQMVPWHVSL